MQVGGLGDVVTALGRAVEAEGHRVTVILPKYDCLNYDEVVDLRQDYDFFHNGVQIKVWKGLVEGESFTQQSPPYTHVLSVFSCCVCQCYVMHRMYMCYKA
jgi:starch synthase